MLHILTNDGDFLLHSNRQLRTERDGDTEKGCQKPAVQHIKDYKLTSRNTLPSFGCLSDFIVRLTRNLVQRSGIALRDRSRD